MNLAPIEARDEDLVSEYERLRTAALTSGTPCNLAPCERRLLSEGLYHWAVGWKSSQQMAAVTKYRNRSEAIFSASPLEKPQSSVVDLIASMAINSITQMRRAHHAR